MSTNFFSCGISRQTTDIPVSDNLEAVGSCEVVLYVILLVTAFIRIYAQLWILLINNSYNYFNLIC